MKFMRALAVQLRQAVTWRILAFAAVFALVQAGAAAGFMLDYEFADVWVLMLMGSISGADYLTIFVLPTLPFSMTLAQDWESRAVPYWTVRTGVTRYTLSKLLSAGIAGFLTVGCGLTLLCTALRIWYPWYAYEFSTTVYERTLLQSGHVFPGFFGYILHYALSGAIIGMFGMLVTCYIPSPFVAAAAPLSIHLTLSRLLSRMPAGVLSIWNYHNWLTGVHDAPTAGQVLLEKTLLTLGLCLLMCIAGIRRMKRRVYRA